MSVKILSWFGGAGNVVAGRSKRTIKARMGSQCRFKRVSIMSIRVTKHTCIRSMSSVLHNLTCFICFKFHSYRLLHGGGRLVFCHLRPGVKLVNLRLTFSHRN